MTVNPFENMKHIVLIGDSIFDNAPHVEGGPDVIQQLRAMLPSGWTASLLAVDGSTTRDVERQLEELPENATHLILSVGGNDGLTASSVLYQRCHSVAEAMLVMASVREQFRANYRHMLAKVIETGKSVALCTVYDASFQDPDQQRVCATALNLYNDCIIREAVHHGLPLLDMRAVCHEPADYTKEIEPSVSGGAKIARAVLKMVQEHEFSLRRTVVYS